MHFHPLERRRQSADSVFCRDKGRWRVTSAKALVRSTRVGDHSSLCLEATTGLPTNIYGHDYHTTPRATQPRAQPLPASAPSESRQRSPTPTPPKLRQAHGVHSEMPYRREPTQVVVGVGSTHGHFTKLRSPRQRQHYHSWRDRTISSALGRTTARQPRGEESVGGDCCDASWRQRQAHCTNCERLFFASGSGTASSPGRFCSLDCKTSFEYVNHLQEVLTERLSAPSSASSGSFEDGDSSSDEADYEMDADQL